MIKLTSLQWWIETFVQVSITMIFMYFIKYAANRFNVPVIKDIANEV